MSKAELTAALIETKGSESVYSNRPISEDPGGETVWGIARNFHPELVDLWAAVDRRKKLPGFPGNLDSPEIHSLVNAYYQANEWGKVCGDLVRDQLVANELFDTAVNIGPTFAIEFLQLTLNALNRGGTAWPELVIDGKMGPLGPTLAALNQALTEREGFAAVLIGLNGWQDCYYMMGGRTQWLAFMELLRTLPADQKREVNMRGWLLRRSLSKRAAKAVYA